MTDQAPKQSGIFPQTRWSLITRVADANDGVAVQALGELLKSYWQPLYVFARRSGMDASDAEDAVQGFCADLIRLESLKTAEREHGRLRSFLLTGFQNHLRTLHRDQQRLKRGGGVQTLSLDDAETALDMHPVDGETPDRAFDRRWAYTLLERVRQRLRADYEGRGRGEVFTVLEPCLVWNGGQMSHDQFAGKLGLTPGTVAQTVKRMRARFRTALEQEISDTVDGPEAMVEEREHLIRVLSGG
ncbi:MAG: RNA polymerase sigma factor [Prosthecobacter sp.]